VIAVQSAKNEYASLLSTGPSCRTPGGKGSTGLALKRGKTMTSLTRSQLASPDKKSRLYCAIPPRPPCLGDQCKNSQLRSRHYAAAAAADTSKAHRLAHAHL